MSQIYQQMGNLYESCNILNKFLLKPFNIIQDEEEYIFKEMIEFGEQDKSLYNQIIYFLETFKQNMISQGHYALVENTINKIEYNLLKKVYGRNHPKIHLMIQKLIEKKLESKSSYIYYSEKRKLSKYFIETEQMQEGYNFFKEFLLPDFDYSFFGIILIL